MMDGSKQLQNANQSIFELIEFSLARRINGKKVDGFYGVNVVKVREVVRMPKINPLNSRIKGIAGVFELRGVPIPVVNLRAMLGDEDAPITPDQKVIVTEFGVKRAGFIVDATHRIRRVNWSKVMPPASDSESYITAMTLIENNEFLFILDLEKILADLDSASSVSETGGRSSRKTLSQDSVMTLAANMAAQIVKDVGFPTSQIKVNPTSAITPAVNSSDAPLVLLVDDSGFILKNTKVGLVRYGLNVITATNGREALEILEKYASGNWTGAPLAAVITDIEMPQMDGFILTQKIRENETISHLPVIIHSSLSARSTQDTGIAMGANGYVVKNDIKNLVEALSEIIGWKPTVRLGA